MFVLLVVSLWTEVIILNLSNPQVVTSLHIVSVMFTSPHPFDLVPFLSCILIQVILKSQSYCCFVHSWCILAYPHVSLFLLILQAFHVEWFSFCQKLIILFTVGLLGRLYISLWLSFMTLFHLRVPCCLLATAGGHPWASAPWCPPHYSSF